MPTNQSMKAFALQSKIKRAINGAILSKPTKDRPKHSLGLGIFGTLGTIGYFMI